MSHRIIKPAVTKRGINRYTVVEIPPVKSPLKSYIDELNNINQSYDVNKFIISTKYESYIEYPDLSKNIEKIVISLKNKLPNEISICDLGMGLGTKLFTFAYYFKKHGITPKCDGVEINPDYIEIFNTHLKKIWDDNGLEITLYNKSLLKHDISNYDFVYLFKPLTDSDKMEEVYLQLSKKLKDGAILFDPSRKEPQLGDLNLHLIDNFYLWIA